MKFYIDNYLYVRLESFEQIQKYRVGSSIEYVGTLSEFVTKLNLMDAMNDITDVNGTTVSSEGDVANAINSEVAKAISSSSTQVNLTLIFGEN